MLTMFDLDALIVTFGHICSSLFRHCALEVVYEARSLRSAPEFSWLSDNYKIDELETAKNNTKIIHYTGPLEKPWRRGNQPSYFKQPLKIVPAALNKKTMRDISKYWSS